VPATVVSLGSFQAIYQALGQGRSTPVICRSISIPRRERIRLNAIAGLRSAPGHRHDTALIAAIAISSFNSSGVRRYHCAVSDAARCCRPSVAALPADRRSQSVEAGACL